MVRGRANRQARASSLFSITAAMAIGLGVTSSATAACSDTVPVPSEGTKAQRAVTARDLVRLRDIGYPDALIMTGASPLALAPDGLSFAFVVNRADPDNNRYCRALVVSRVSPNASPRVVDTGGELITVTDVQRGMFVRGGFPAQVTPAWSPDGRFLAYLKRLNGRTQVWLVREDGSKARVLTQALSDVESLAWSADGRRLVYGTRPAKWELEQAADREGRSGWLYDDRVVTFSGPRPQIRIADAPLVAMSIDLETGATVPAKPDEAMLLRDEQDSLRATPSAIAPDGMRAWIERDGIALAGPNRLQLTDARGRPIPCPFSMCRDGVIGLWWDRTGRELRILRREGWNKGDMALYRWRPGGKAPPRRVFLSQDVLIGCLSTTGDRLLCMRENATTPRQIVLVDPRDGHMDIVFDPNPEFGSIALGKVERIKWRNDRGLEAWGDLVLPPNYKPGQKLPLIVVQYHSNGFLRGGTGDDYPIFLFAAHGFAVLSFERPPSVATFIPGITDWDAFNAANAHDWANRRSLLSAIETGVQMAIDRGIADPGRIGITGLSDGATSTRFALINARMFAAAAISTCCLEPVTVMTYGGIAFADHMRRQGYPAMSRPDNAFWRPASIAMNAKVIDTPLLMQLADDEYLLALEAYTALREHGKPVEMYVFPNEYHAKWQPEHRVATYERSLDWFNFWLRWIENPDPAKAPQYSRWRAMRSQAALRREERAERPPEPPS